MSVGTLLVRARDQGYSTLALTDVENLYAQVRFHAAAKEAGVKPITGIELHAGYAQRRGGSRAGRLVLLARNRSGYEFLCRVVTRRRGGPAVRRLGGTGSPLECLKESPEGVFWLTDDPLVLQRLVDQGVPTGDIRFLASRPDLALPPFGVRAVADPDVVMLERGDYPLHVLLAAIREGRSVDSVRGIEPGDRSLPTPAELAARFQEAPDLLEEAQAVADQCNFDLLERHPPLPEPELPNRETPESRLQAICRKRLGDRGSGPEYRERLENELAQLERLGLAGYFLIAGEIADLVRSRGIPLAGRGSAGSSLVAWLLGLSEVDPVEHGLLFERFVHPDRRDLPDIDLDIASNRREEVLAWVERRFGADRVAAVCAHQTLGRKAAVAEGRKALGKAGRFAGGRALIERLIGRPRHLSVHPGGLVLCGEPLIRYVPLERAPKGVRVTQYDMNAVARLRLVKIDLLGNRALAALGEVQSAPAEAPDDERRTLDLLREARTVGCFQIETPLMRSLLRKMPVRGVEDLMAALAVVRPGPGAGEAKAGYLRRARGEEAPDPPHPRLQAILESSYGMILYEEDLVRCIAAMTGWSVGTSDRFRSELIDAGADPVELERLEERFLAAGERTGLTRLESGPAWNVLERFAGYSFNKAHAASYALIAWQSAAFKASRPAAFGCAVLNHYGGQYPLRTIGADLVRQGIRLLPPSVLRSMDHHVLEGQGVRIGLGSLRSVTEKTRRKIRTERPFRDLRDFLTRVPLPMKELESLVLSGACDELPPLSPAGYPLVHERVLAAGLSGMAPVLPDHPLAHTYRRLVRIRNEIRMFGLHPSGHPIEVLREEAAQAGAVSTVEAMAVAGKTVRVAGLVAASHRIPGPDRRTMQFVTLEDEKGLLEATVPPGVFASLGDPMDNPGPFLIDGLVLDDRGDRHLRISKVRPFHERQTTWTESIGNRDQGSGGQRAPITREAP